MHCDVAIIGSGPSCYAYLLGSERASGRNIVFSSDRRPSSALESIHPKLYRGGARIIDPLPGLAYGPTCNWGGLSSAWGGILIVPGRRSPDGLLCDGQSNGVCALDAYCRVLNALRDEFPLYVLREDTFRPVAAGEPINVQEERTYLLAGTAKHAWENGGISLESAIRRKAVEKGFELTTASFDRIEFDQECHRWRLVGAVGEESTTCGKLVLAAGGIGNLRLIQSVYPQGDLATYDHVPLQLYCLQVSGNHCLEDFSASATPLRTVLRGEEFVVAAYCLGSLSASFLRKMRLTRIARACLPDVLLERLYFVQLWHESLTYKIGLKGPIGYQQRVSWPMLAPHVSRLLNLGLIPVFATVTAPGEGFHYLSIADDRGCGASEILGNLRERYGESLQILGGLSFAKTMLENPTLTFMADAYVKALGEQ